MYVLKNIKNDLKSAERSTAISPLLKLAATLKFLAQGEYQHQIGQDRLLGFSQSSVSLYMVVYVGGMSSHREKHLSQDHSTANDRRKDERGKKKFSREMWNTWSNWGSGWHAHPNHKTC